MIKTLTGTAYIEKIGNFRQHLHSLALRTRIAKKERDHSQLLRIFLEI